MESLRASFEFYGSTPVSKVPFCSISVDQLFCICELLATSVLFNCYTLGFGLFKTSLNPADTGVDAPIPLPNVSSKILAKVIEYCRYHVDAAKTTDDKPAVGEEDVKTWDAEFVKVEQSVLFDLILVSANICALLDDCVLFTNVQKCSCTKAYFVYVAYLRFAFNKSIEFPELYWHLVSLLLC